MMMHNRQRRNEFFALQKQLREDSLEAARLAYMTGTATEEQIALVEDATARAKETGVALPSILSVPQRAAPAGGRESVPGNDGGVEGAAEGQKKAGGITAWLFSGMKKEEARDDDAELSLADGRWRTTSANTTPTDTAASSTSTSIATTTDAVAGTLRDKAKAAFEQERENQQNGGPLDQIGQKPTTTGPDGEGKKKKGWLW